MYEQGCRGWGVHPACRTAGHRVCWTGGGLCRVVGSRRTWTGSASGSIPPWLWPTLTQCGLLGLLWPPTWKLTMMPRLGELVTSRERVCRPERSALSLCLLSSRYRSNGPMAPEQLQSRVRSRQEGAEGGNGLALLGGEGGDVWQLWNSLAREARTGMDHVVGQGRQAQQASAPFAGKLSPR